LSPQHPVAEALQHANIQIEDSRFILNYQHQFSMPFRDKRILVSFDLFHFCLGIAAEEHQAVGENMLIDEQAGGNGANQIVSGLQGLTRPLVDPFGFNDGVHYPGQIGDGFRIAIVVVGRLAACSGYGHHLAGTARLPWRKKGFPSAMPLRRESSVASRDLPDFQLADVPQAIERFK
jgi:hypothetical protein